MTVKATRRQSSSLEKVREKVQQYFIYSTAKGLKGVLKAQLKLFNKIKRGNF